MNAVILARPSRPVEVPHDGRWVTGWLEAYRRDGDGWRACVRNSAGVGMQHVQWRGEAEVRRGPAERPPDVSTRLPRLWRSSLVWFCLC